MTRSDGSFRRRDARAGKSRVQPRIPPGGATAAYAVPVSPELTHMPHSVRDTRTTGPAIDRTEVTQRYPMRRRLSHRWGHFKPGGPNETVTAKGRILNPVHDPIQVTGVGAANTGTIRGDHPQSEIVGRGGEVVRGQSGIGQPVAEQNRSPIRPIHYLDGDHTAVALTQLHPDIVSLNIDLRAAQRGKTGSAAPS